MTKLACKIGTNSTKNRYVYHTKIVQLKELLSKKKHPVRPGDQDSSSQGVPRFITAT